MTLSEYRDLRGGAPLWTADERDAFVADRVPSGDLDVAVVGAGIMGAMIADRLSAAGREVSLFDRRPPGHGATAASTALVMWAADVPLTHLAAEIGADEAIRRWRRIHRANRDLARLIDRDRIACDRKERPELYLAGTLLDEDELRREAELRSGAGLPSRFLPASEVGARFGIAPRAAILSEGSYGVDPVDLTLALIERTRARGGSVHCPVDVTAIARGSRATCLSLGDGSQLRARTVILATGYERPSLLLPAAFTVQSSYAIATSPAREPPWREGALIWEASSPYFYGRMTRDGRVVAGGEDEVFADASRRDAVIGEKAGLLMQKLASLTGTRSLTLDFGWSASFGASPDGLPAIGRAQGEGDVWLAYGFGGNGVTFAALGADIVVAALAGTPDPDAGCFDPYRFPSSHG